MRCKSIKTSLSTLTVFKISIAYMFFLLMLVACSSQQGASVNQSSASRKNADKVHIVKSGETLFSIAKLYGLDYKNLSKINNIDQPYRLYPSQRIRLTFASIDKTSSSGIVTKKGALNRSHSSDVDVKNRSNKKTLSSEQESKNQFLMSSLKWQWPSSGKIIALFGGVTALNKGIDLGGKLGEPVLAAAAGQVVYAGSGLRGYGKLLIIKHNDIFLSAYAHNNELLVKEGDFVKVGQKIADMGSSGTDRVKLHFEIRSEGNPVDPLKYLPKR